MESLTFLERAKQGEPRPVYVLYGDEDFLKRQVLAALRERVPETAENAFGLSTYPGDKATFAAVHDELQTMPFLSSRRLVVVENADPFVTKFRAALEKYVAQPASKGVLVLDVKSWPANTRLAKLLEADAAIECKTPNTAKLASWCSQWVSARHGKQLANTAANLLVSLVGPDMGLLDQELTKLAIYVGTAAKIESSDVDKLVGCSREENTWKIFDAVSEGRPKEALAILERLFDQGQDPLAVLGAFTFQLRRLAQVARLTEQGQSLASAMDRLGLPPFAKRGCEHQLRHLGRRRAERLYDWLIEVDLGLKGSSQLPPRTLLERLVLQLARKS
jgi:DNA polymerase-3 subunit delta